ncbi:MAG: DEAD/DEAH box helicase [Chthoniobacterales bacterium]|nr:DEAD/DEAH box helicase [Chthoniobacterales bacterium]
MKQAQQMQAAGRVSDVNYEAPLLLGMVREGTRNLRSGLRIKTESDVENLCTCRESREWGKICAHALAVGVEFLAKESAKVPETPLVGPAKSATARPTFVESGSDAATSIALHFILPPNFDSAWAKGHVMVVTEVEIHGARVMPTTLKPQERYACDTFDLAALNENALAPMRTYPAAEFLNFLRALRGHPRVTFGKGARVEISPDVYRPRLRLERGDDGSVRLDTSLAPDERLLVEGTEAWVLQGNRFRPLREGLPNEWKDLVTGTATLRGAHAQQFLAFEAARLREWFHLEMPDAAAVPDVQTAPPKFVLQIEGSLRELQAELRVRYADGMWEGPLCRDSGQAIGTLRSIPHSNTILLRDIDAERAALRRLEALGFTLRGERLVLTREDLVARFFAFEYQRLKNEWEVTLSAQATRVSSELQPLQPQIEIVGSGENWFELRYSLGTPDGQSFSAAELQRLLRSGQTQTKLRNGRVGVFDAAAIEDFEEVLRDCEPKQNQPGLYRINRTHASYVTDTALELGVALHDLQRLAGGWSSEEKPVLGAIGERLRNYQKDGVAWLWQRAQRNLGGVLADEMGLGKTVQTLAFLLANRSAEPALIVCPTSLVTNWRNEAQRWTPELRVLALEGPNRHTRFTEINENDIVLTSYALLQRDAEKYKALQFSTVVLDEAQHIKNPDTQNAQVAFALRARHRFVLTGTPIENSVRDLWSIMNFALPGYLGSRADFRERYEHPLVRGTAPEVQRRLARRMRPFLLRRRKTDVAKELPEKIEQQVICDLTPRQRAAYDGLLREIQTGIGAERANAGAARMKMLVGLLRLRQVCCDLRLLGGEITKNGVESAKLDLLEELIEEAIDGGHRVLVFSQFVAMLTLIRERLEAEKVPFSYLDGSTKDRQSVVDRFQNESGIPVFLMSLKAGGVGLNLSAADTVIHFDPWWNYAAEAQATDRAHRIGQTRVVTAYKLIARETVEEKIVKLQERKRSTSEATIGSEEPLMSGLTTEDLEELLR